MTFPNAGTGYCGKKPPQSILTRLTIALSSKLRFQRKSWSGLVCLVGLLLCLSAAMNLNFSIRFYEEILVQKISASPAPETFRDIARVIGASRGEWRQSDANYLTDYSFQAPQNEPYTHLCSRQLQLLKSTKLPQFTVILSLYQVKSQNRALFYLQRTFQYMSDNLSEDIIITADSAMNEAWKNAIEDAVDLCAVCRLFFFRGTIYEHRNSAAQFARTKYIVFVDARIVPSQNWLQPLMIGLREDEKLVISPQLHLHSNNGHDQSVGVARNEITWDLSAVRGPVDAGTIETARESGSLQINHTVISREVLAIHKDYFLELRGFDIIPEATGGEHVSFSLKVLNCGGNIVSSLCSHVALQTVAKVTDSYAAQSDFFSPTFSTSYNSTSVYYNVNSKVWLDSFSTKYYYCAVSRLVDKSLLTKPKENRQPDSRLNNLFYRPESKDFAAALLRKYGTKLKQFLSEMKCGSVNFRNLIATRQPNLKRPTRLSTYNGYIRTRDGMFAFGMFPDSLTGAQPLRQSFPIDSNWGNFVLTRNVSLWFGPFSFTNGAFVYENFWCLSQTSQNEMTLTKCIKGMTNQLFTFVDHVIRPLISADKCACVRNSGNISSIITVTECSGKNLVNEFKMDVEFIENCTK